MNVSFFLVGSLALSMPSNYEDGKSLFCQRNHSPLTSMQQRESPSPWPFPLINPSTLMPSSQSYMGSQFLPGEWVCTWR